MKVKKVSYMYYLVMALVIMIIPNILVGYTNNHTNETFHEELRENREMCYKEATQNNFSRTICNEIISNARHSYSPNSQTLITNTLLLTGIIFGLAVGMLGLKKQVDDLKEKLNV